MKSMNRKCSDFSGGLSRPAIFRLQVTRLMGVVLLAFSLGACSYVRSAVSYAKKAVDYVQNTANQVVTEKANDAAEGISKAKPAPKPMMNVVLHSAPRHLMVKPRTDPVWLWDKPGGSSARAIRINKVPSGTPGKVVEIEPEPKSSAIWAEFNFDNVARQPVRWMKVATLLGVGWVRVDFVKLRKPNRPEFCPSTEIDRYPHDSLRYRHWEVGITFFPIFFLPKREKSCGPDTISEA